MRRSAEAAEKVDATSTEVRVRFETETDRFAGFTLSDCWITMATDAPTRARARKRVFVVDDDDEIGVVSLACVRGWGRAVRDGPTNARVRFGPKGWFRVLIQFGRRSESAGVGGRAAEERARSFVRSFVSIPVASH